MHHSDTGLRAQLAEPMAEIDNLLVDQWIGLARAERMNDLPQRLGSDPIQVRNLV